MDCLIAEFIDATGTTLASGALDAWAIDGMRAEGNTRASDRFFAHAQMLARALMIVGGLAGGYLAQHRMELTWFAGAAIFTLTALGAAVLMRDAPQAVPRPARQVPEVAKAIGGAAAAQTGLRRVAVPGYRAAGGTQHFRALRRLHKRCRSPRLSGGRWYR